MLVGGLRAAVMGLPFLPTRAALGSQLAEERGFRTVLDPYTGDEFLAVPAIRPDVAFVHAWRADEDGNVQFPWPPDHLADVDLLVARAARTVVVSVEEIVSADVVAAEPERTKLFGFEVDLLVEAAGGARPGSCRRSTTRTRRGSRRASRGPRRRAARGRSDACLTSVW